MIIPERIDRIIINEKEITDKISELAENISKDYSGKNLILIVILKGACLFLSELSRRLTVNHKIDFISASRLRKNEQEHAEVSFMKDLDEPLHDKDVLILEDIVENGYTLNFIYEHLKLREPKSLRVCALFDKPYKRKININISYTGFIVPDEFLVGFGLDMDGKFRNLPYLATLKK